jgi:hypothetical protein
VLGDEHPDVVASMNDLAAVLYAEGEVAAAEPLLRESLAITEKETPSTDLDTAGVRFLLGMVLMKLGQYPEAEPYLLAAHEVISQTPSVQPQGGAKVEKGLVEFYETWHAAEPGKSHDAKAAEWRMRLRESTEGTGDSSDQRQQNPGLLGENGQNYSGE